MNNNQPKRNKLPLILASLLSIALITYGSFAYFTDEAKQEAGLKLTLGTVDITNVSESWKYTSLNEDGKVNPNLSIDLDEQGYITGETKDIKNVLPGDQFSRVFKFKNEGKTPVTVTKKQGIEKKYIEPFTMEVKETLNGTAVPEGTFVLIPGGDFKAEVTISIDKDTKNEYNIGSEASGRRFDESFVLNLLESNYEFIASQELEEATIVKGNTEDTK